MPRAVRDGRVRGGPKALTSVALLNSQRPMPISPRMGLAAGALACLLLADSATGQIQGAPPLGENAQALTPADWLAIGIRIAAPLVLVILFLADFIRPGSFRRAGKRDVVAFQWPVWLFGAFVVVSAQIFGAQAFSHITGLWDWLASLGGPLQPLEESNTRDQALTQLGSALFGIFAGAVMVFLLNKREHDEGMRFGVGDVPLGLVAIIIAFPVIVATGEASRLAFQYLTNQEFPQVAHPTLELIRQNTGDPWTWVIILTAIIGAAAIEELIFRAFIQTSLLRMTGSAWLAIILTSAAFALVHRVGDTVPWHQIPTLFVLGIAIGVAYERFKGLGVPIAMHAGFNAANIALVLFLFDPTPQPPVPAQPQAEQFDGQPQQTPPPATRPRGF